MTETTPGMFQRALDRVAGFIRADQTRDRHIEEMDQKFQLAAQQENEERAKVDAIAAFGDLAKHRNDAVAIQRDLREMSAGNDDISSWSQGDWQNVERVRAKVMADMESVALSRGISTETHNGLISALEAVRDTYVDAELDVRVRSMEADSGVTVNQASPPVHVGRWQVDGYGQTEIREVVVETEAGFHPGVETSHMGGDGHISHSEQAFDNPVKARVLAWAYIDGGEKELEIASRTYDVAAARITDLARLDKLSLGQQVELQSSLTELGIGINNIRRENTAALEGWSQDFNARAKLAETVERHRDQMYSTGRLLREASVANVDIHDRAALDSYVSDTYGSEEAYLRHDRVLTAFQNMAAAYKEGQLPAFQSAEAAREFRADVEQALGEGTFDRLRAGNTDALIAEIPSQGQRFMAVSALQVAWSREGDDAYRAAVLDHNEGVRLQSRVISADWYSGYSDDSTVRQAGAAEVSRLNKDLSDYAARSPSHAAWISRSFDEHGPADVRKFTGYVKEADRDAVDAFPESNTSSRSNLTAQDASKNHNKERELD